LVWLLLGWVVARAAAITLWLVVVPVTVGDVNYYYKNMHKLLALGQPAAVVMPEYPTPVLWALVLPYLLGGGTELGFRWAFVSIMLALDLAFTLLLWWRRESVSAAWVWVVFGLALGPIIYLRLDLLPALAVAGAILALVAGRHRVAGALLGVGAGLKLWPATIYPLAISGQRRRDHLVTVSFFVTGVVLVVAAIVQGGWGRLISPLQWQSGRGLQIESVWASVPMVERLLGSGYRVEISPWQAFEISGPGVGAWLAIATVASLLGYAAILIGYVGWFRTAYPTVFSRRPRLENATEPIAFDKLAFAATVVITITLITNKTFSPQYLTWLGAASAVFLLVAGPTSPLRRTAWMTAIWVVVLAIATQVIYPLGYDFLVHSKRYSAELRPSVWTILMTAVLVARNVGVLALAGWQIVQVFRQLAPARTPKVS
jgi:hypothetical protein